METNKHPAFSESTRKGSLFAFEGIDGSGKSTILKKIASWLNDETQHEAISSFEPTDGPHGRKLREAISSTERLSAGEELELFRLDRLEHVTNLILPSLDQGMMVLLDRYYYSSIAYQSVHGSIDPEEIHSMMTAFAPTPNLTFLFDVDVDTALDRIQTLRNHTPDLLEKRENLVTVKSAFDKMEYPEIVRIDANEALEEIFEDVRGYINSFLRAKSLFSNAR
ncbi:dTMP kinase [bacterium]|nr:dTMP kinase [bacterium]